MSRSELEGEIDGAYKRVVAAARTVQYFAEHFRDELHDDFARRRAEVGAKCEDARAKVYEARRNAADAQESGLEAARSALGDVLMEIAEAHRWSVTPWDDPRWGSYEPSVGQVAQLQGRIGVLKLPGGETLPQIPAVVDLLSCDHVFVTADADSASVANALVQAAALRMVVAAPPGLVHLGLIDPLSKGQLLSGFLRLPGSLRLGEKLAATSAEIEALLVRLLNDAVEITQTRLTNMYNCVEEYNAGTTGLTLAYRILVVADFPAGFTDGIAQLLLELAHAGPRTGLHIVGTVDEEGVFPKKFELRDLTELGSNLRVTSADRITWDDALFGKYRFMTDPFPLAPQMNSLLDSVGRAALEASVRLPFARIAVPEGERWNGSSVDGLRVLIGLDARGEPQHLEIGTGAIHHGLIGGDTQMGKTNLLHVLLTQLCLRYSPEELDLYLLDFKEVEFDGYLVASLPHARAIASRTDREFGLSVLRRFREEIERRSQMFRETGTTHIADYRRKTSGVLPRAVVVMDEFQVMFRDDDRLSAEAGALLEDIARRGAAFGLHLLLASQSPGSGRTIGYLRPIYEQMALRIALGCRLPSVSQAILGDGDEGATHLLRPGEAIYNDRGAERSSNRTIRIAELPNSEREGWLKTVSLMARGRSYPPPATLDPDAPAQLQEHRAFADLFTRSGWDLPGPTIEAWLGEPIEIRAPTAATFERFPRSNLLVVGDEAPSHGLLLATILSIVTQRSPDEVEFVIVEFARPSSPFHGFFDELESLLPHHLKVAGPRSAALVLQESVEALPGRRADNDLAGRDLFIVVAGIHRWHEAVTEAQYGQQNEVGRCLAELADRGPEDGVHVLVWSDGFGAVERALRRNGLGLFDLRVAFRVSENDSIAILGTPAAARLADNRALFRVADWESGRMEKFKPYPVVPWASIEAMPFRAWAAARSDPRLI